MGRNNKLRKRARKARNAAALEALLSKQGDGTRVRRHFIGKERSGSAVTVDLTFSGVPVPVLSSEENLTQKHLEAQRQLNEQEPS